MTDLTEGRGQAPARVVKSPAQTVAQQMRSIRELQTPLKAGSEWRTTHPNWVAAAYRSFSGQIQPDWVIGAEARKRYLDALDKTLADLPPYEEMVAAHQTVAEAVSAPYDAGKTRIIVAMMIDGYPNARPHNPTVFMEGLIGELSAEGFAPAIVAAGCNEATRTMAFLPAISEVTALCRAAHFAAEGQVIALARARQTADDALDSIDVIRRMPPADQAG